MKTKGEAFRFVVMAVQKIRRNQPETSKGEALWKSRRCGQVTAASDRSKPLTAMLMEEVVRRENLLYALKRVRANKGSPGIDGMTVEELPDYLKEHLPQIREELLRGDYIPQPVKRVTIPKPGGGMRELGVPVALDRFIQQAIQQVLTPLLDPTFLSSQLWISTVKERSSGGGAGQEVHRGRLCVGSRY